MGFKGLSTVGDWRVAHDGAAGPSCSDRLSPTLSLMVTKKRSTLPDEIQGPVCVDGLVLRRCIRCL